jgi:hypothetical protein
MLKFLGMSGNVWECLGGIDEHQIPCALSGKKQIKPLITAAAPDAWN